MPMILVSTPVKYNRADFLLFCVLCDTLGNFLHNLRFFLFRLIFPVRKRSKHQTLFVVNQLNIQMLVRMENCQTWSCRTPCDFRTYPFVPPYSFFFSCFLNHNYALLPAALAAFFPSFRRITSPSYRMPFP